MKFSEKTVNIVGWSASFMAIAMYFSYIDQIRLNIAGNPGSFILPIVTMFNCTLWVIYGSIKEKKDWPLIVCNIPGIFLGGITFATTFPVVLSFLGLV